MAIDLCSDDQSSAAIMSPARISFSHDISQSDIVPVEQYIRSSTSSSTIDFDFCVFRESFDGHDSSSLADELFSNGKILPIEIKRRIGPPQQRKKAAAAEPSKLLPQQIAEFGKDQRRRKQAQLRPDPTPHSSTHSEIPPPPIIAPRQPNHEEEIKSDSASEGQKQGSRMFWKFKRSSSLNCGSGYARTLCPLPLLSRSNSTGSSSPIPKRALYRDSFIPKQQSQKSYSSSSSTKQQSQNSNQKPPLKKFQGSANSYSGNGVRNNFNPVLNVPSASLFGLGNIFSHGRDKNKRK